MIELTPIRSVYTKARMRVAELNTANIISDDQSNAIFSILNQAEFEVNSAVAKILNTGDVAESLPGRVASLERGEQRVCQDINSLAEMVKQLQQTVSCLLDKAIDEADGKIPKTDTMSIHVGSTPQSKRQAIHLVAQEIYANNNTNKEIVVKIKYKKD